jgi:hypothetical protein
MKEYNQEMCDNDCILPSFHPFIGYLIGYMDMDGVICYDRVTSLSIHCKYIIIGSIVFLNGGNGFAKNVSY